MWQLSQGKGIGTVSAVLSLAGDRKQLEVSVQGHSSSDTNFPVSLVVGDVQFSAELSSLGSGPLFCQCACLMNQHVSLSVRLHQAEAEGVRQRSGSSASPLWDRRSGCEFLEMS